ncbi:MAG: hypothetical protein ACTHM6_06735 [Tepidisphaeraceae bacterium]
MKLNYIIFLLSVGGMVGCLAYFVLSLVIGKRDTKLYGRLRTEKPAEDEVAATRSFDLRKVIARIGQAAASPFMPKDREKTSGMRKQLAAAGI